MADDSANFDEEEFYKKLLLEETKKLENLTPDRHEFVPKPGYVIKLRSSKDEKVFINVCTSDKIPAPKEVSDQELVDILQSVDPTQYRVPMSLGEPHVELDNRGQGVVYSILEIRDSQCTANLSHGGGEGIEFLVLLNTK